MAASPPPELPWAYEQPVSVAAENGAVLIEGPGFEMVLTPQAALESVERMRGAAEEALRQRDEGRPAD